MKKGVKNRGNGQGCAIKTKHGWKAIAVVGYRNGDYKRPIKRTKSGFLSKTEALAYIPVLKNEKKAVKTTFDDIYTAWEKSYALKLSESQKRKMAKARERLDDIFYIDITMLRINDLQDCVDANGETYYNRKDCKVLLSHLYNRACAEQIVQINLAEYITLPTLEEKEQIPFTDEDVSKFWKAYADGNIFVGYILLMIYTGMMPGELLKCEKKMIDYKKHEIVGCGIKTSKRKKTSIVLADVIIPVLKNLCDQSDGEMLYSGNKTAFYDAYNDTISKLDVSKLPPYSCRHTTATALSKVESNIETIREIMRHTNYKTTERYIHKSNTDTLSTINKLCKK